LVFFSILAIRPRLSGVHIHTVNHLKPSRRNRFQTASKNVVSDRPNQLWVANLTYVAIPGGFVYLAAILDAWLRKVVGYAFS
jgi:transposase InsO family protein